MDLMLAFQEEKKIYRNISTEMDFVICQIIIVHTLEESYSEKLFVAFGIYVFLRSILNV